MRLSNAWHPVHVALQVVPRGRGRGADTGGDAAPAVPAGQASDTEHGHLLPAGGFGAVGQLCCTSKGRSLTITEYLRIVQSMNNINNILHQ